MAGKLKLSEVRGDVRVGSAGTGTGAIHAIKDVDADGRNVPYCPTRTKTPLRSWGQAHEQKPHLELCIKCSKLVPTGPVEIAEEQVSIPGLNRTVTRRVAKPVTGTAEEKTETDAMAAKNAPMKKAEQEKAAEEIRADIERLRSLIAEGKDDSAKELAEGINAAIPKITGTGAAAIKAKLRAEAEKAEKDAKKAKADAKKPTDAKGSKKDPEIVVKGTQDFMKAEGVPDRIVAAAEKVKEVAAQKFARGKEVAEAIFDIRTHILDKDDDPDLTARSDQAKKAASAVYDAVLKGLPEEGTDETADIIREAIGDIKKDVRNAMTDVVVGYVRALDQETPETLEERKRFAKALDAYPDLKPSEAVFKHYEEAGKALPKQTRAEIAKATREKKALERKKVEDAVKAGELSEEEAAETLGGGTTEEKSPKEKRAAYLQRMKNSWKKHVKEIKAIENAEEQEEALDELTALLSTLRKELKA
ncbi:hypothetical protein [Streptomyces alkaliterrae]|uniref:Uncharacterized protein n=1 Tax=Streptomyces alkaliterrae TaxID=2213162 RepID=A0A5P0YJC7_9ACTN|nr:hypothetical protein [Streptomyces alkaliterrae]MBB1251852.1 hypothetical protein [Streptomyces alkaliterrae]MBB1259311.1 hypothetical protein [Streptomyces alkaliterrae]MQS00311.1 hypothetical protein [Streptomyces alkaliterrae]